jgi:hypothetical protein
VIRLRVFLGTGFALAAIFGAFVRAQSTDEEKKKKAREEMRAVTSPTPSETPEPTAKPKPAQRKPKTKKKATPTPTPTPKPKKTPARDEDEEQSPTPKPKTKSPGKKSGDEEEDVTPKPKAKASETPVSRKNSEAEKSPTPKKKAESEKETPKPKKTEPAKTPSPAATTPKPTPAEASAVPRPAPRPTPRPVPPQSSLPSDITVEKSGIEQEQGFEPPPPPPPKRGWWPFSRQPSNYRYLSSANIDAIRRAPVQRARWKFVIVHNSGTRQGSARVFDYYHRHVRRMKNGLAYHFVIGNGTSTRNGQIEIGDRWIHQMRGGHVHSDYMNNIGLGICLVGDFNRDQPTRAQLEACEELIKYLQERCGKMTVRPHREVNPPRWATDCPGDVFPYSWFGRFR